MLYKILKNIAWISVQIFFKKIRITGLENISSARPMLIAANHTNAFLDAISLQVFAKQDIYTLARSDVFNTPFKKWLLKKIMMYPIYRIQEGADNLHKNAETFEICNKLLIKNKSVMMFPEGVCIQQRRLCKLKKGLARIAFGSLEAANYNLDLQIVPVGINYSTPSRFGGNLLINIGKPISLRNYIERYQNDKVKTMNQFTTDLEKEMERLIITISDESNNEFVAQIEKLFASELLKTEGDKRHLIEKAHDISRKVTFSINETSKTEPEKLLELKHKTAAYFSDVKKLKLKDWQLKPESLNNASGMNLLIKILLLAFTFPLFLIGLVFNYLPFKTPYWISKKIVKNIEFFSSLNLGFGMFIFMFYYLIQITLLITIFKSILILLVFLVIAPGCGLFALNYLRLFKEASGIITAIKSKHQVIELAKRRREIVEELRLFLREDRK